MSVKIHETSVIFGMENITFCGWNVRFDALSMLSAGKKGMEIGDFVHIGVGSHVFGHSSRIVFGKGSGVSASVNVFGASDNYTSGHLTGPCVPSKFRDVKKGDVIFEDFAIVGCGSTILPGVTLGRGCAVGANTLVRKSVPPYAVVFGPRQEIVAYRNEVLLERLARELDDWCLSLDAFSCELEGNYRRQFHASA